MATVEPYSLGNGQRRYRVRYRTPDRRSTEKRGFTTKKAAQDWAATVEVSKMMGTYVPPSAGRVTVGEVAEGWLTSVGRLKATTKAARQSAWDHRVKPRWGTRTDRRRTSFAGPRVGSRSRRRGSRFGVHRIGSGDPFEAPCKVLSTVALSLSTPWRTLERHDANTSGAGT